MIGKQHTALGSQHSRGSGVFAASWRNDCRDTDCVWRYDSIQAVPCCTGGRLEWCFFLHQTKNWVSLYSGHVTWKYSILSWLSWSSWLMGSLEIIIWLNITV